MRPLCLICVLACAAAAQTADGITVSVSRIVNIAPDQAEFVAVATTSLETTQQRVTQALQDLGVSSAVVTAVAVGPNVYYYQPPDPSQPSTSQFYYQINFAAPVSALKEVSKKLDAFRTSLPDGFLQFQYVAGLTASQAAVDAARQPALTSLLADARSRGQSLAAAAGLKLGAITGLLEYFNGAYSLAAGIGLPAAFGTTASFSSGSGSSVYTFYATVKFAAQ